MRLTRLLQSSAVAVMLAACSQAHVQSSQSYFGPPVPRPNHIVVSYYSITPDEVKLDQAVGARLMRVADDQPPGALELQAAQETQAALAEGIVARLQKYGLPAELPTGGGDVGKGTMLVQGQIVGINQGNRTRRMLIGLGAGKSSISADTQVYYATDRSAPPRFMMSFEGQADSGHLPGAVETLGAGAAAQSVGRSAALTGATHAGAETHRSTDTAEANKLADGIALRVAQFAVDQGWIPRAMIE
jgi:Domain of unknown function (DUF4410)